MSRMSDAHLHDTPDRADRLELRVAELEEENRILANAIESLLPILELEAQILRNLPDHQRLGRTNWPMIVEDLRKALDSVSP